MSRRDPGADCYELSFQAAYPLDDLAELALEDYARALAGARGTEAIRRNDDPMMVSGVHVCGLGTSLTRAIVTDIEDFARDLVMRRDTRRGES